MPQHSTFRQPTASQKTVSQLLVEHHGITIQPGSKGECPFCHGQHFSLKKDDSLGKCFSPTCSRFLAAEHAGRSQWLPTVLTALYHDFHTELLALDPAQQNAHNYLRETRGIHSQVIADAMLGAVPWTYDVVPHFQPAVNEAQAALQALQQKKKGRPGKDIERAERRVQNIQDAQGKLVECLNHRAGWLAFFYTNAGHRPVALRLRQPYAKNFGMNSIFCENNDL